MKTGVSAPIVKLLGVIAGLVIMPGLALSQSVFTHAHLRVPEGQQEEAASRIAEYNKRKAEEDAITDENKDTEDELDSL